MTSCTIVIDKQFRPLAVRLVSHSKGSQKQCFAGSLRTFPASLSLLIALYGQNVMIRVLSEHPFAKQR